MTDRAKLLAIFLWMTSTFFGHGALAKLPECTPKQGINQVEVSFADEPNDLVPPEFALISAMKSKPLRIEVSEGPKGVWKSEKLDAFRPYEYSIGTDLRIEGYDVPPIVGRVEPREDQKCYGVYRFTLKKAAWTLEVSPDPEALFKYWIASTPNTKRGSGTITIAKDLSTNVRVDIQVHEIAGAAPRCLFTLRDIRQSKMVKAKLLEAKDIAELLYEERDKYSRLKTSVDFLCAPDDHDPYQLQIAEAAKNASENQKKLLLLDIETMLKLRSLELRDGTETMK